MSPVKSEQVGYAAFRLRFRAYVKDAFICLGVFLLGGITAGIVFENSSVGRIVAFLLVGAFIVGYEPFMVAWYGGTLGHRSANIRVVRAKTGENLTFWRAAVRALVKWSFGLFSFAFMFVTNRAQGLHDLIAGAEVRIRDPWVALETDLAPPLSAKRRMIVISLYILVLSIAMIIVGLGYALTRMWFGER